MAFESNLLCPTSTNRTEGLVAINWTYGPSTDSIATITASGYFDDFVNQVTKDDKIYLVGSNGNDLRVFTNITGVAPVTVAAFITAGDLADGSVTEVKIQPNALTGTVVANAADLNVIGAIPLMFIVETPGGATASIDVIMTHKIRVTDVQVLNIGLGTTSDTIRVLNTADAITEAMDIDKLADAVTRNAIRDPVNAVIAASGTLRVTETDGGGSGSPATTVFISAVRVA